MHILKLLVLIAFLVVFSGPRAEASSVPLKHIQEQWWIRPGSPAASSSLEHAAKSLVLGQTTHQVGDAVEGLFYLLTFRPRKAIDHLSNGLNPLGLVNSVVSDVAGCAKAPFCDHGIERPAIQVAIQNISQMNSPGEDHWAEIITAPLNPGKHVGLLAQPWGKAFNWGGSLNLEKPIHFAAVHDSRDQSDLMAIERLECASNWLLSQYPMSTSYSLLGYNCGGFVADVLEIAGMSSPFFANCGIGQELRIEGPPHSFKDGLKTHCGESLDLVPEVLEHLEKGQTLSAAEKRLIETRTLSPHLYVQAVASSVRGRNIKNLHSTRRAISTRSPTFIFGDSAHHVTIEVLSKKIVGESRMAGKIRLLDQTWQPSLYARTHLDKVFHGLDPTDLAIMKMNFPEVYVTLEYYCGSMTPPRDFVESICSRLP